MMPVDSAIWWIQGLPDTFPMKFAHSHPMLALSLAMLAVVSTAPSQLAAQPVVQPLPGPEAMRLNAALTRLARDPRDVMALTDAGEAAMALGDFEAASGFFRRANETRPGNGRALAGLAASLVLSGDPYSAIPIFAEAEKAGANMRAIAPDRGLAYDLVGANTLAQDHYRQALANDASGEVRRRLALSLAISGDATAADEMLLPLLRQQDKPAWRTRSFVLAITGRTKEAVDVTNTLLPPDLAQHIGPYLRYMPQLTPAQQAAAANLGRFPRASEMGRDDPRIAAFASLATPRPKLAAVDAALVPKGDALGSKKRSGRRSDANSQSSGEAERRSRSRREGRDTRAAERVVQAPDPRAAPPELKPTREITIAAATPVPSPPPASVAPAASPRPVQASIPALASAAPVANASVAISASPSASGRMSDSASPAAASTPTAPPGLLTSTVSDRRSVTGASPLAATANVATAPGFDLANLQGAGTATSATVAPAPPVAMPERKQQPSFSELFSDLGKPVLQAVPAAGAVDVRKIEPAKPKPVVEPAKPPPPKPAPPTHPSRIWVQLGVGQNMDALKFDWRKLNRQHAALFKGQKAYVSDLGRTNRLLTGPFESRKAAGDFVANLAKAGLADRHMWISPAGQVVDPLGD